MSIPAEPLNPPSDGFCCILQLVGKSITSEMGLVELRFWMMLLSSGPVPYQKESASIHLQPPHPQASPENSHSEITYTYI